MKLFIVIQAKNLKELRIIYKHYPKLWNELKEMDKKSYNKFRNNYSIEELENKFAKEKENKYER